MFCPICRAEFRDGFDRCNQCEVALVREPPAEPRHPDVEGCVIASYRDLPEAELAAEYLVANGIAAVLHNAQTVGINWLFSNVVGGVELVVPDHQEDRARLLLSSLLTAPAAEDEPSEFAGGPMPASELERSRTVNRGKVLLALLIGAPETFPLALPALLLGRASVPARTDERGDADLSSERTPSE